MVREMGWLCAHRQGQSSSVIRSGILACRWCHMPCTPAAAVCTHTGTHAIGAPLERIAVTASLWGWGAEDCPCSRRGHMCMPCACCSTHVHASSTVHAQSLTVLHGQSRTDLEMQGKPTPAPQARTCEKALWAALPGSQWVKLATVELGVIVREWPAAMGVLCL